MQSVLRCCMVKDIAALRCVLVLKLLVVSYWDEEKSIGQIDRVYLQDGAEMDCRANCGLP